MGKKLDALLRRTFKTSKFSTLANLAVSRIAFLEKQHRVRCNQAGSDVIQLLNLGHHERALLRIEIVIREQNMLDAYAMIENYCHLLMERMVLIHIKRECPDELKEAISSLIFAASRCGELPELQKIREMFTSRFGKEFATRAVELISNCGVNTKIVKKLSTRRPSLDSKLKMLKEIAPMNEITANLEKESSMVTEEKKVEANQKLQKQSEPDESAAILDNPELQQGIDGLPAELKQDEKFSEAMEARKKYKDFGAAAEAAFKLATHAAEAARAAVELSRPQNKDPDDGSSKSEPQCDKNSTLEGHKNRTNGFNHEKSCGEKLSGRKMISHMRSKNVLMGKEIAFARFDDEFNSDGKASLLQLLEDQKASTLEGGSRSENRNNHRDSEKQFESRFSNIGRKPLSSRSRRQKALSII